MKRSKKEQIMKQCFGLFISGKTKRAYFIGIMRNPYKPIKECIMQKAEHLI